MTDRKHSWGFVAGPTMDLAPPLVPFACAKCGKNTTGQDANWPNRPEHYEIYDQSECFGEEDAQ